jgi:hypothetical protein
MGANKLDTLLTAGPMVFDVDGRMYVGNALQPMVGCVPDTTVLPGQHSAPTPESGIA